jgi:hypothetical protein
LKVIQMELLNQTPFASNRFIFLGRDGKETLLIVVRASFSFEKGRPVVAEKQLPVQLADEYRGEPEVSSIARPMDLAPEKPGTDILVEGFAYAQRDARTSALVVLQLGSIEKAIRVVGDRTWRRGLRGVRPSAPKPFVKLPVIYERTFGGTDASNPEAPEWLDRNPVGLSFRSKKSKLPLVGTPVPNQEDPERPFKAPDASYLPRSLGAIAPHWSPRAKLGGTFDDTWRKNRMPMLPSDFNTKFYQAVPSDQVLPGYLYGKEIVKISGMRPEGVFSFSIPTVNIELLVDVGEGEEPLACRCDTLSVDCEGPCFSLVFRGVRSIHGLVDDVAYIRVAGRVALD